MVGCLRSTPLSAASFLISSLENSFAGPQLSATSTDGSVFAPGSIIAGTPARLIRQRDCTRANRLNAWVYHRNAQAYRRGEHRAWDGPEFEAWIQAKREQVEADRDLEEA